MPIDAIIGLVIVAGCGVMMFLFSLPLRKGSRSAYGLRSIHALARLRRAIGLAVESGARLHVTLGKSSGIGTPNAASLVALSTLDRITRISLVSDRPPVATSGEAAVSILSQDTLRSAYRSANVPEQYDPARGRLAGVTPLSYAAGALPVIHSEHVAANILIGTHGPESALLAEGAARENAFSLAATDSLPGQAVLYAAAEEPLIGEELFAVPAYLQAGPYHRASLRAQDILRWIIILLILIGALLKLAGVSLL